MLAAVRWKCPDPGCPASDFRPADVTSTDDQGVPTWVCAECSKTYPASEFKRVR